MDPNLTCILAAQYIQDRMVAAEHSRTVREVKRSTPREPKLQRMLRRFARRSPAEAIVPTAPAGAVVPPSH